MSCELCEKKEGKVVCDTCYRISCLSCSFKCENINCQKKSTAYTVLEKEYEKEEDVEIRLNIMNLLSNAQKYRYYCQDCNHEENEGDGKAKKNRKKKKIFILDCDRHCKKHFCEDCLEKHVCLPRRKRILKNNRSEDSLKKPIRRKLFDN
jgi:hypothetical protein